MTNSLNNNHESLAKSQRPELIFFVVLLLAFIIGRTCWGYLETDPPKSKAESVQESSVDRARLAVEVEKYVITHRRCLEERLWINQLAAAVNETQTLIQKINQQKLSLRDSQAQFLSTRRAVYENPLVTSLEYGEIDTIRSYVDDLVSEASAGEYDIERLSDRFSDEDFKFMLGFVHWYLSRSHRHWRQFWGPDPLFTEASYVEQPERGIDEAKLKNFSSCDFDRHLGEVD